MENVSSDADCVTPEEHAKRITDAISYGTETWELKWASEFAHLIASRLRELGLKEDDRVPLVPIIAVLFGIYMADSEIPDSSFDVNICFYSELSKEVAKAFRYKDKGPDVSKLN